ncbi:TonB-dependent receptor [Porticoccaceae bacterium]|nr:TonB-dependent receptor [Porticoccaceae bacterium]
MAVAKKTVKQALLSVLLLSNLAVNESSASNTASTSAIRDEVLANQSTVYSINLPAQTVADSLASLSEQLDILLLFPYQIASDLQANPVKGKYTLSQTLELVLQDTGFSGRLTPKGVLMISLTESDSAIKKGRVKERADMNVNHKTKKTLLAAAIGLFAAGGTGFSVAQDEGSSSQAQIDEVIVTAQKREERLIDVPMSISVVDSAKIESRGIQNFSDLSYAVPNLSVTELSGGNQIIAIRGVSNISGSSPLVGIYLDEIPLSVHPLITPSLQAIDIKQVEVLKGPQGMLYGQGSVGGTMRFITNAPEMNEFNGEITASIYDTDNGSSSNELTMVANLPVIDDQLAFRIVGTYRDKGGWIDRINDNADDINDDELSHIRLSGLWEASDNLSITAMAIQHRNDFGATNFVNTAPESDSKYLQPVRRGLSVAPSNTSHNYDIYNLVVEYDLGFARLTSATSKFDIEDIIPNGASTLVFGPEPGTPLDLFVYNQATSGAGYSQELRLTSSSDKINWTLGLFYDDAEFDYQEAGSDIFIGGNPISISTSVSKLEQSATSTSIFGTLSYNLSDKVTVDLGGRYYEDDKSQLFLLDGAALSDKTASFDNTSFRGALSYAVADNANIYFSVAQGFRSGGINFFQPAQL